MAIPVFYDCEASSLDGVPIEIGWAFVEAKTRTITSEAHLVRPPSDWNIEDLWDPNAEALHGISLHRLRAHGRPPREIARRMNEVLRDRELYADSSFDEAWLTRMFEDAESDPAFIIRRMNAEALISQLAARQGFSAEAFLAIQKIADELAPRDHRAEADARHLAVLWNLVAQGSPPQ